ncbi:TPA: hypothetical protein N0F65_003169 [Lagenidium giganteum]|uniref:EF-hand domain-containing protein n=1 Tax=Lagenidium giganteum TaxID=4803 RepID=A0AAV2Z6K5_9STRA|nr:TPA: hypothetical protein N0F65_003169 [Lagenidium giganteum]
MKATPTAMSTAVRDVREPSSPVLAAKETAKKKKIVRPPKFHETAAFAAKESFAGLGPAPVSPPSTCGGHAGHVGQSYRLASTITRATRDAVLHVQAFSWGYGSSDGALARNNAQRVGNMKVVSRFRHTWLLQVAAGNRLSVFLTEDHDVFVAGRLAGKQDGTAMWTPKRCQFPPQPSQAVKIVDIAAGHLACYALDDDGRVYSWGTHMFGQLGHEDATKDSVEELSQQRLSSEDDGDPDIKSDDEHDSNNNNSNHSTSDTTTNNGDHSDEGEDEGRNKLVGRQWVVELQPRLIESLSKHRIVKLQAGNHFVLAISSNGMLFSWGRGCFGQLGLGSTINYANPQLCIALLDYVTLEIAAGDAHAVAVAVPRSSTVLRDYSLVFSWGRNASGCLGCGGSDNELLPREVTYFRGLHAVQAAAGSNHSLVLCQVATRTFVYAFGGNEYGQLGVASTRDHMDMPEWIEELDNVYGRTCQPDHRTAYVPWQVDKCQHQFVTHLATGVHHTLGLVRKGEAMDRWRKFPIHGATSYLIAGEGVEQGSFIYCRSSKSRTAASFSVFLDKMAQRMGSKVAPGPKSGHLPIGPTSSLLSRLPTRRVIANRMASIRLFPTIEPSMQERAGSIDDGLQQRTMSQMLGEEFVRHVRALFHACDLNEDGFLDRQELCMLLELVGLPAEQAGQLMASASMTSAVITGEARGGEEAVHKRPAGTDMDMFLQQYGAYMLGVSSISKLPPHEFLHRCKRLKIGFLKCDGDENHVISRTELEIALQKLDLVLPDQEFALLFAALDRNKDNHIEWSDFVYAAWKDTLSQVSPTLQEYFSLDSFDELPSFLRPTTDASKLNGSERRGPQGKPRPSFTLFQNRPDKSQREKSRIEKFGVDVLTRISMQRVSKAKVQAEAATRHGQGPNRISFTGVAPPLKRQRSRASGFPREVRSRMHKIELIAICVASLTGIVCGLLSVWLEQQIPLPYRDQDIYNGSVEYFAYIIVINVAVSLLEVHGMYVTAVVCAFRLTICTNLVLYPQDAEREFLTRSIARAALQVGHRQDKLFGIDPMKGSPRLVLFLSFLMYKSKRYMLKFLVKLLIKRVLWRAAAKSILNLLVLPINGIMNAWTIRGVMLNCRVSIIGPPCVVQLMEIFFVEDGCFNPQQRLDYLLTVGCCLVCKRCVHPNIEIMVDMMRKRWMTVESWPVDETNGCRCLEATHDPCPQHPLDDVKILIGKLNELRRVICASDQPDDGLLDHRRNMFFLMVVALVIDGSLNWEERRLYIGACNAAGIKNCWPLVLRLKTRFVKGKGIKANEVFAVIKELPVTEAVGNRRGSVDLQHDIGLMATPLRESISYIGNAIARALSC